jgi:hypothetical protein
VTERKDMNIQERLDQLREIIQTDDFLEGKGLSNEVNIWLFCYDPKDEPIIRHFTEQLEKNVMGHVHPRICDLYRIFLSICDAKRITDKIPVMEEKKGKDYLLEPLRRTAGSKAFVEKMKYEPHKKGDILVITGVGDAFPFIRVHDLLNAMQPEFSDVPILVFYPGVFDGYQLQLFSCLPKNSYYRAFNVI